MKKLIIIMMVGIITFFAGILFTVETMKVDIPEETERGAIVRITILDQWFNHYVEKDA